MSAWTHAVSRLLPGCNRTTGPTEALAALTTRQHLAVKAGEPLAAAAQLRQACQGQVRAQVGFASVGRVQSAEAVRIAFECVFAAVCTL